MATPSQEQPTVPMLKGSWDELLQRAQQLAANRDDEAIAIYDKLIGRLVKMPKDARMANEERLQNVLVQACVNAQAYLSASERYDQAIEVMEQLATVTDEADLPSVNAHKADIMVMAGRVDEAAAIWRDFADKNKDENNVPELSQLMLVYMKAGQLDDAETVLQEFETAIKVRKGSNFYDDLEAGSPESYERDQGYVHSMRSLIAMENGQWKEANELFTKATEISSFYLENCQQIYARLVNNRQYELAMPWIEQDKATVVGPAFWTGLVKHHLGEEEEAKKLWTTAVNTELDEAESRNFFEMIMAFYYMGDEERLGLELTLRLINESRNPNWSIFFLAGVGQAIQGDMNAAHTNMGTALQQSRVVAEGTLLSPDLRMFVEDLLDEETQAEFDKYFKAKSA